MKIYNLKINHKGLGLIAICLIQAAASGVRGQGITSVSDAFNYGVIYWGTTGNNLNINNGPGIDHLAVNGNIGIGGTGNLQLSGPLTIDGNVNYSGTVMNNQGFTAGPGPFVNGNVTINGSIAGSVTQVQNDIGTASTGLTGLSAGLGGEAGMSLAINTGGGNQTVNVSGGTLDGAGNRVFNVSAVSFGNGQTLTINGTASQYVVFNIGVNGGFNGGIVLTGGITSDHVIFNFIGGQGFQGSGNFSGTGETLTGIFLDPLGTIQLANTVIDGRVFGGDSHDMAIVSGSQINQPTPTVPDAVSTMLLLGLGLGGIFAARKKFAC